MTPHLSRLLAATALACATCLSMPAHAITSFDIEMDNNLGNVNGLAYRESDGHLLLTRDGFDWSPTVWSTPLLREYDSTGQLVQTIELTTLMPGISVTEGASSPASGGGLYLKTYTANEDWSEFTEQLMVLSPDLSSAAPWTPPIALGPQDRFSHVTDSEFITFNSMNDTVKFTSLLTGETQTVSLAGHFGTEEGCLEGSCIASLAPSWSGGFFAVDDSGENSRLMEFDRQGNLLHTVLLDHTVFGYHPQAIDTDLSGRRIFLSMNNLTVLTFSEHDFLTASIPEPATWASMGLGLIALAGAAARTRRQRG